MTQMEANVVDGNTTTDLLKIHGLTRDTTALYLSWAIFLATSFIFLSYTFQYKSFDYRYHGFYLYSLA